ncbi:pentapeptide repeat-containing protein [Isosphaeraceae bacterium EP7]
MSDVQQDRLTSTPRRRPTAETLNSALEDHQAWLNAGGADGQRADLSGLDLSRLDLRGVDLRGANLSQADLTDTNLRDAQLQNADLSDVRGLLSSQVGGANLSGALLPESVLKFENLAGAAESSRGAQGLFTSILLACAYTWITLGSTTDTQLVNKAALASSKLPILGIDIPLVRFYMAAPILLLCLYVYFHLGLQRLWEDLSELPAVFPDGRSLDKKAPPWLLNSLVRPNFIRLRDDRPQLSRWQAFISVALAWGLVPITLLFLWARFLRCHDLTVSGIHVLMLAGAIGAAVGFHRLTINTLRGMGRRKFSWRKSWQDARLQFILNSALSLVILGLLTFGAILGVNPDSEGRGVVVPSWSEKPLDVRHWAPRFFSFIGYSTFAHLDGTDLSVKPLNWNGEKATPQELGEVKGADLGGSNIRYGNVFGAFLVNAYLKEVKAEGCDMRESDLRRADLREARLVGVNFRSADLRGADLRWADLTGARLKEAKLEGATLNSADLTNACLDDARLASSNEQGIKPTSLREANLHGASLVNADLRGVDLRGANLADAILTGVNFKGANLVDVIGLTRKQVEVSIRDDTTKLPASLSPLATNVKSP